MAKCINCACEATQMLSMHTSRGNFEAELCDTCPSDWWYGFKNSPEGLHLLSGVITNWGKYLIRQYLTRL